MIHFTQVTSPEGSIFFHQPFIAAVAAPKTEEKIEPGNVLSKRGGSVAARLRSLRSDNPLNKGNPRSIKQEVQTSETFQTHLRTIKLVILSI